MRICPTPKKNENYYNVFQVSAITETTPSNHVPGTLQQQPFISNSINPDDGHMSNSIRQVGINMANELSELNNHLWKIQVRWINWTCKTNTKNYSETKNTVMGTNFPAQEI